MDGFYTTRQYRVDWQLPTRQPTILIAQLGAKFVRDKGGGRLVHQPDPNYVTTLRSAVAAMAAHGAHVLVFPEYTCPLMAWPEVLDELRRIPEHGVCVLPFEHLTLNEFERLIEALPATSENRDFLKDVLQHIYAGVPSADQSRAIVNVALNIVRAADGLHFVPQPKLRPAELEETSQLGGVLVGGVQRNVIVGRDCSFTTVVCFDFVTRDEAHGMSPRDALADCDVHLVFVPECNPNPLHQSYGRAISELFLQPKWTSSRATLVFCNVSSGTVVPELADGSFGYSRIVGQLGRVTPSRPFIFTVAEHDTLECDRPASLQHVLDHAERISIRPQSTLLFRPHESLIRVRVPTLGLGPSADPTVERTNTEVLVLRRDPESGWREVRALPEWHVLQEDAEMPAAFVVREGLIAADDPARKLDELLRGSSGPIWVVGDGGVGKTALVATVLDEAVVRPKTARIVWVDMAAVGSSAHDVAEALLTVIGKPGALSEPLEAQWKILTSFFKEVPSVLVLDSLERWSGTEVPAEVLAFHQWPSRVLLTSRREPEQLADGVILRLEPLAPGPAADLVQRVAGRPIPADDVAALYGCLQGSPLACVWVGGVLSVEGSAQSAAGLWAALRGGRIRSLEDLFDWCLTGLTDEDLKVLGMLCEVPAPVSVEDLANTLQTPPEVAVASLERLQQRNLVMTTGVRNLEVHTRHPFVRLFWERVRTEVHQEVWRALVRATESNLAAHGGDRNWRGFILLRRKWPNIRHVLNKLAAATSSSDRLKFLELWRAADYMLWAIGLWRERVNMGSTALNIATELGARHHEAHALYDAIAETSWHLKGDSAVAEEQLTRAAEIYSELGERAQMARVEYYRGRLQRHSLDFARAVETSEHAVALARSALEPAILGASLNGYGNALRAVGRWDAAMDAYAEALPALQLAGDEELVAVVSRNRGRVALDLRRPAEALRHLESAMDDFRGLELEIEAAETAIFHARALAELGECIEAESELNGAANRLVALGSRARERDVEEAREHIKSWVERQ